MKNLIVNYNKGEIVCEGNIDYFKKPKIKIWLYDNNFSTNIVDKTFIINDSRFTDDQFLYDFKKSLERKFKNIPLVFSENFKRKIINKLNDDKNFEVFSKKALEIWDNKYDLVDFKSFINAVTKSFPLRKLYRLQVLSGYHLAFSQNACNFSVPGAGKTSIVYSAFAFLNNLSFDNPKFVNKILIIGPPSSFEPWETEFFECFGRKPKSFRFNGGVSIKEKKKVLNNLVKEEYELLLITYQSVANLCDNLSSYLNFSTNKVMLVCDEAHKFKSLDGIWASHILKLSRFANSRVVLTGTPVPNGYEDLYNLFKFLYPEKKLLNFKPGHLKHLTKHPNQADINNLINNIKPYFVRIKKSDLNLPEFNDSIVENKFSDIEGLIYKKLNDYLCLSIEKKHGIFFRLIQACNNIHLLKKSIKSFNLFEEDFGENIDEIDLENILGEEIFDKVSNLSDTYIPSKHIEVGQIVQRLKSENQKAIIWGVFIDSIKRLNTYLSLKGFKGNYVIGETPSTKLNSNNDDVSREGIINDFKNNDLDYIITNPTVLGESISLHKVCHNSIYFELSYSAAPYIQSRDRIHRVWLDENGVQKEYETNYYHLIATDTLDDKIYHRVQLKFKRMMEIIEKEDIPFFEDSLEDERSILIKELIDEYRS